MAGVKEEEDVEYESDPDEAKLSLAMRRREASDDEEEEEDEEDDDEEGDGDERAQVPRRIDSDGESEGQGAPADYDDDDEEEELEEEEYEEEYEEREVVEDGGCEVEAVTVVLADGAGAMVADGEAANELEEEGGRYNEELEEVQGENQVEEEKKENEPFAVPTAGAFYMHDDRFRDNAAGRHRRTLGGRKLWESKDDNKWGHDKFEEMTLQEGHNEEGRRNSRGRYRARGKKKTADHGYQSGNRTIAYDNNNPNPAPKAVRGRGPRRYEASSRNGSEAPSTHNRQYGKSGDRNSHPSSGRSSASSSHIEADPIPPRKHMFASSLNIASPPFYPSGSSNKEITVTQKRDSEIGSFNRNLQPAVLDESFPMPQSNAVMRGKNLANSIRMDKVYKNGSISTVSEKSSNNCQLPSSGSSLVNSAPTSQSRAQGRGITPSRQMNFQPIAPHNQVSRVFPPTHMSPVQTRVPSVQTAAQQLGKRPGGAPQASSPPKAASSINSFQPIELESSLEFSKSKGALVGKVRDSVQGSGMGSFLYNGAQIVGPSGNMGSGKGDQNFPTPTFLPVMPFGGQHPRGMGVPAVGMAFPGYVAQPQGLGNSEMTWLPVLAGAAGALGGSYCPPYITVDGAYHAHTSGQASALGASGKETVSNPADEWTPQRSELTSDEAGQRQNNARRYSKMSFGQ